MSHLSDNDKKTILGALRGDLKWSADILLDLLQVHQVHNRDGDAVRWVDPGFFSLVVTDSMDHRHYEKNSKDLHALLHNNGPETLLIPIYGKKHWSLLVYRRLYRHWYACDSAGEYHRKQVELVLSNLCKRGFIDDNEKHIVTFFDKLTQQDSNFECGLFTLLYCLVFASNKAKTEDEYDQYLDRELALINNHMRQEYRDSLISIINDI